MQNTRGLEMRAKYPALNIRVSISRPLYVPRGDRDASVRQCLAEIRDHSKFLEPAAAQN